MIIGFNDKETQKLYQTGHSKKYKSIEHVALRKLDMLNASVTLEALKIPPNNRLEPLNGDRIGQYSIQINDQYQICFVWDNGTKCAKNVEIVDYH